MSSLSYRIGIQRTCTTSFSFSFFFFMVVLWTKYVMTNEVRHNTGFNPCHLLVIVMESRGLVQQAFPFLFFLFLW